MMKPIRFHLPGIPHTITNNSFSHCAFTGKVLRFSPMMQSIGHEVIHYGVEGSESGASNEINLLTKQEWQDLRLASYQLLHPEKTPEHVEEHLADEKNFVGDLANLNTPLYQEFNKRFQRELKKHYQDKTTDILCIPFGRSYLEALKD